MQPLRKEFGMDAADQIPRLVEYGDEMGQKVLNDDTEPIPSFRAIRMPE